MTATLTLPRDDQILVTRDFDAPRRLVFRAWTTPELVRRWWHANRGEMTVADIDLRVGGGYRYAMVTPEGFEVAFHGTYREVVPDERLVSTEVYEAQPMPEDDAPVNIVTFADADGGTRVTMLTECGSREVRDAIIASGMEDGLQDALSMLEEVALSVG